MVNQNRAVMSGSKKATNTSATGLRMSISARAAVRFTLSPLSCHHCTRSDHGFGLSRNCSINAIAAAGLRSLAALMK